MDSLLKENLTLCVRTVEPQTPYRRSLLFELSPPVPLLLLINFLPQEDN
uniref:Uncharacterized protein n=1 Tax=Podoviridae sp. ctrub15 TaxID=2826581 RepID=A0A8S5LUN0_9CAUD|nr:MAG TPA: hypothetical protein [Podoviridae sp. ctrub15]